VNLGYYLIKLTEEVFDDLKNKKKILRFGDIIASARYAGSLETACGKTYLTACLDPLSLFTFNPHLFNICLDAEND
jgi:hypothetical protein